MLETHSKSVKLQENWSKFKSQEVFSNIFSTTNGCKLRVFSSPEMLFPVLIKEKSFLGMSAMQYKML